MKVNSDLHMLELEWEELSAVQLNSPTQIQKHLVDTKVHVLHNFYYANLPMQYTTIFHGFKNVNFHTNITIYIFFFLL